MSSNTHGIHHLISVYFTNYRLNLIHLALRVEAVTNVVILVYGSLDATVYKHVSGVE